MNGSFKLKASIMKPLKPVLMLSALCFLLSACRKEINNTTTKQTEKSQSEKTKVVPFKGEYLTTNQPLAGPPLVKQKVTGMGEAASLGNSMFIAYATVNVATPPPFVVTGTATFIAADGSEFYTEFTGTNTPKGDGTASILVTHHVTGGTGRFANASGTVAASGYTILAEAKGSISYDGTIVTALD